MFQKKILIVGLVSVVIGLGLCLCCVASFVFVQRDTLSGLVFSTFTPVVRRSTVTVQPTVSVISTKIANVPTIVLSPTPNNAMILQVTNILGKSVSEVEKSLGKPVDSQPIRTDDPNRLIAGGELRVYRPGKYEYMMAYNKSGIAKGFQISDGLDDENYSLDQWNTLLTRLGFQVSKKPDVEAVAGIRWDNYNGYKIWIGTTKPNGPVWSIKVDLIQ